MAEAVNNPAHYGGKDNPYEAIKVIRAWGLNFNTGNAAKYISRAGKKDPEKEIEDLEKAVWYLNDEIAHLKAERDKRWNAVATQSEDADHHMNIEYRDGVLDTSRPNFGIHRRLEMKPEPSLVPADAEDQAPFDPHKAYEESFNPWPRRDD